MIAARDPGPIPELAWLPVDKITVDHTYQRHIQSERSKKLIQRIADDFRWCAFQAVLACPAADGGGWLVLDGQHRVEAARIAGIAHVPAVVVEAGSLAEQAMAFVRANLDRVGLNQYALFHARIAAEDPQALAVKRVADAAGIDIPRYPTPLANLKPGQTLALGGVSRLVAERGEEFARELLGMVARVCAGTHGQIKASLLRACSRLVEGDRDKLAELSAVLGRSPIEKFFAFCASRRGREGTGEAQSIEDELRSRMRALAAARPAQASKEINPAPNNVKAVAPKRASEEITHSAPPRKLPGPAVRAYAPSKPAPVTGRAAQAEEERLKAEFIAKNGVGRIAGELKTVATTEQAVAALEAIGVKATVGSLYSQVHGKKIYTKQLVEMTNQLLAQRQIVRVKPGEQVPA